MVANIARAFGEPHPDLASKWTLASADAAISQHERGDFRASAMLVDAMGRDDRIAAVLGTRILGVLGLDFELEPNEDGDGRQNKSVVKSFQKPWARFATEDTFREALKWRIMLGFGIGELIWYDERNRLQNDPQQLKIWHPQHVRYDFDKQKFVVRTEQGEVEVTHGDEKWVVFGHGGQRPWMSGAVRSLWLIWLGRQYGWRDLYLFGERTGQGILKAKVPEGLPPEERSQLVSHLRAVWRGVIAELPQGTPDDERGHDLELLETGTDQSVFDLILSKSDTAIAVNLLGQNLSTEVTGGSFAATTAHNRVRADYLEADTDNLASDCQSGILEPWAQKKHGSRDLAPYPHWHAEPPEDNKASAEAQSAFGDVLKKVKEAGKQIKNLDELAEKYGLELEDAPEPEPTAPPPGQTAVPGQPMRPGQPMPPANDQLAATELAERRQRDPGFENGADYVDRLVAVGTRRAEEALARDIEMVVKIVQAAESPEMLRAALTAFYASMDQTELAKVLQFARTMAELAGRYSVIEDLTTGS